MKIFFEKNSIQQLEQITFDVLMVKVDVVINDNQRTAGVLESLIGFGPLAHQGDTGLLDEVDYVLIRSTGLPFFSVQIKDQFC